ncbi:DUF4259 domain-containing protein [Actinopolymorpha pittospori]|uniref:DUF4259 domain-containing protein n=1 Tax=Actinopolymorpha pittospori TaxID=648752 RepID=A0A927MUP3_9ACTN|nr:DUF4259 domain-containing protein [Actinopolymorpha pittospori]MBE1605588.1 hypothetical protein [Actinopolymorpha pittospori]
MGTWGMGPFENDPATDLCRDLGDMDSAGVARELERVLSSTLEASVGYLDVDLGQSAIAASVIVMAKFKSEGDILREVDLEEIVSDLPPDLLTLASRALSRVLRNDSEIYGLWVEGSEGVEWKTETERLLSEVDGAIAQLSN